MGSGVRRCLVIYGMTRWVRHCASTNFSSETYAADKKLLGLQIYRCDMTIHEASEIIYVVESSPLHKEDLLLKQLCQVMRELASNLCRSRSFSARSDRSTNESSFFSTTPDKLMAMMKKVFASIGGSVRPMTLCRWAYASTEAHRRGTKISIIIDSFRRMISEIKLKRTDTTLDLSQKAKRAGEKRRGRRVVRYL